MPFHVEIRRSSFRRAQAFNLDEGELRTRILEPWRAGLPVEFGDHEWDPAETTLTVIEGPRLEPPDLAVGQGWHNASRRGRDVTRELLAERGVVRVALAAPTEDLERAGAALIAELALDPVAFRDIRAHLRAGDHAGVSAALVLTEGDPAEGDLVDAGLAAGAFGPAAVIASVGGERPALALEALGVLTVASLSELANPLLLAATGADA